MALYLPRSLTALKPYQPQNWQPTFPQVKALSTPELAANFPARKKTLRKKRRTRKRKKRRKKSKSKRTRKR
jgi:hypothetical protein